MLAPGLQGDTLQLVSGCSTLAATGIGFSYFISHMIYLFLDNMSIYVWVWMFVDIVSTWPPK